MLKLKRDIKDVSWEDVIPKLKYKFGKRAVELCLTEKEGDPSRRRFTGFRTNYNGFDWIIINFREKYLNIYLKGNPENAETIIQNNFTSEIELLPWANGYSFNINKEKQFNELVEWLNIGNNK